MRYSTSWEQSIRIPSVSRSDSGSAPSGDLYSPECQWRPCRLDAPQRRSPAKTATLMICTTRLDDHCTRPQHPDKSSAQSGLCCSLELNHAILVLSAQRLIVSRFFLHFCHQWRFCSLPLSPLACLMRLLDWLMRSLNHQWTDFNCKKYYFFILLLHHWQTILLFDTVKLLWHSLCIKHYINKGHLTLNVTLQ